MCWRFGVLEASSSFQAALVNDISGSNFGNLTSHWQLRDLKWLPTFEGHSRQVNSDCSYNEYAQNAAFLRSTSNFQSNDPWLSVQCPANRSLWNCTWYIKWYIHYKMHRIYYVSLRSCFEAGRMSTDAPTYHNNSTSPLLPLKDIASQENRTSYHRDTRKVTTSHKNP